LHQHDRDECVVRRPRCPRLRVPDDGPGSRGERRAHAGRERYMDSDRRHQSVRDRHPPDWRGHEHDPVDTDHFQRRDGSGVRRAQTGSKPSPAAPTAKESEAIVEDVFLLNHKDGLLIKHETRRLRPDVDTDILSGMLTAVQAFVKDALRGDDYADLNEMTVGHMHILIGRGRWLVLAARIEGDGTQSWTSQIERCIKDMEDHHWDQIEDWDG